MSEKQINMSDAQYILSTKLILVPFLQIKISRAMAIYGFTFERLKAIALIKQNLIFNHSTFGCFFCEKKMPSPIIQYFQYEHLPEHLQQVSKPIGDLARQMDEQLPDGPEKSTGLRKLLEAKDAFVRQALSK